MSALSGVFLPAITPFLDGAVDLASYERLLEHALAKGVTGIIPLGTTGESAALEDDETAMIVERTVQVVAGRVPVFVGIGGNATAEGGARGPAPGALRLPRHPLGLPLLRPAEPGRAP